MYDLRKQAGGNMKKHDPRKHPPSANPSDLPEPPTRWYFRSDVACSTCGKWIRAMVKSPGKGGDVWMTERRDVLPDSIRHHICCEITAAQAERLKCLVSSNE
jgi:hypothetical protein